MTTLGHSRGGRCTQTDGACGRLRLSRDKNLQNVVPVDMNISVDALSSIVGPRVDNKTIVGVNVSKKSAESHKSEESRRHTLPCPQHDIPNLDPRWGCVEDGPRRIWSCVGVLEDVAEEKSSSDG